MYVLAALVVPGCDRRKKNNAQQEETNLLTLVLSHYRGMAPVAHVLFNKFMKFNPKNPKWLNRDRFVLS